MGINDRSGRWTFSLKVKAYILFILLAPSGLGSCVNTSHIQKYATDAVTGVGQFGEIGYGFEAHCEDRCQLIAIDSFRISRKLNCPCGKYKSADSVIKVINKAVVAYFTGLSKLAKNDPAPFSVEPIRKELTAEELKLLSLQKEEVKAYSDLTNLLASVFSDSYRQKKIKKFVRDADPSIQVLLSKMELIMTKNLAPLLEIKKERLFEQYQNLLVRHGLSDYEKRHTTGEYYMAVAEVANKEKQIELYARTLKTIATGNRKMAENIDKISAPELTRNLLTLTSEIEGLISDFNRIKIK